MPQEHLLQLQASWPAPGGGALSGTAMAASAGGGNSGGALTATTPLDAQAHATLFASAAAYTDEEPLLELEMNDK